MKPRILLLDDDLELQTTIKEMLAREGYEIFATPLFKEAEKALNMKRFDLLLVEGVLSKGDGISLIANARKNGYAGKVLLMSKWDYFHAQDTTRDLLLNVLKVSKILKKPFELPELLVEIRQLFEPSTSPSPLPSSTPKPVSPTSQPSSYPSPSTRQPRRAPQPFPFSSNFSRAAESTRPYIPKVASNPHSQHHKHPTTPRTPASPNPSTRPSRRAPYSAPSSPSSFQPASPNKPFEPLSAPYPAPSSTRPYSPPPPTTSYQDQPTPFLPPTSNKFNPIGTEFELDRILDKQIPPPPTPQKKATTQSPIPLRRQPAPFEQQSTRHRPQPPSSHPLNETYAQNPFAPNPLRNRTAKSGVSFFQHNPTESPKPSSFPPSEPPSQLPHAPQTSANHNHFAPPVPSDHQLTPLSKTFSREHFQQIRTLANHLYNALMQSYDLRSQPHFFEAIISLQNIQIHLAQQDIPFLQAAFLKLYRLLIYISKRYTVETLPPDMWNQVFELLDEFSDKVSAVISTF